MRRPSVSAPPPGAKGAMMRTGLAGQVWAAAGAVARRSATKSVRGYSRDCHVVPGSRFARPGLRLTPRLLAMTFNFVTASLEKLGPFRPHLRRQLRRALADLGEGLELLVRPARVDHHARVVELRVVGDEGIETRRPAVIEHGRARFRVA